jgi:hypothetical protein
MAPDLVVLWLLPEHVRVRRLLCLTGMWINGGALDVCLALPSVQTYIHLCYCMYSVLYYVQTAFGTSTVPFSSHSVVPCSSWTPLLYSPIKF